MSEEQVHEVLGMEPWSIGVHGGMTRVDETYIEDPDGHNSVWATVSYLNGRAESFGVSK